MAWYDRFLGRDDEDKLNPAQSLLGGDIQTTREPTVSYERQYEELEIVNRAVNMVVDDAAEIPASFVFPETKAGISAASSTTILTARLTISSSSY